MLQQILDIIQNVGFPIACVVALSLYANKTTDKLIILTEKVTDALSKNSEKLSDLANAIERMERKD